MFFQFTVNCLIPWYPLVIQTRIFKKIDVRSQTHPRCIVAALLIKLYLIKTFLKCKVFLHIFITRGGTSLWKINLISKLTGYMSVCFYVPVYVCTVKSLKRTFRRFTFLGKCWIRAGFWAIWPGDTLTSLRKWPQE